MTEIKLRETKTLDRPDILLCMCRGYEEGRWYCGSSDFKVYELDLMAENPHVRSLSGHRSYVSGTAMTAYATLVTSSWDRQLVWWNLVTGRPLRRIRAHDKWIRKVVASPCGQLLASVGDDMVCRVWDSFKGELRHELYWHQRLTPTHFPSMLYTCVFSPDGHYLATADRVGRIVVWDVESGDRITTLHSPELYTWDPVQRRRSIGGIRSLRFSPDTEQLAVGGVGQIGNVDGLGGKSTVHVYHWRSGERTHAFEHDEHKGLVEDLQFVNDSSLLIGAGGANKGFLLFMDLAAKKLIHSPAAPMHIHQFDIINDQLIAVGHAKVAAWKVSFGA